MDRISKVYYINLAHRSDRKKEIEEEVSRIGFQGHQLSRVDAISTPGFGALGCGKSHIKAIEMFLNTDDQNALILEDDFMLTIDVHWAHFLVRSLFEDKVDFDIVMFAGNVKKEVAGPQPYLHKVLDAQTTSGYLLSRQFAPRLLEVYKEAVKKLEDWYNEHHATKHDFCIDQYWKQLQPEYKWYIFHPKLGLQRESYSDIEMRVTKYSV